MKLLRFAYNRGQTRCKRFVICKSAGEESQCNLTYAKYDSSLRIAPHLCRTVSTLSMQLNLNVLSASPRHSCLTEYADA